MAAPLSLIDSAYSKILKDLQEDTMINQLPESSEFWNYVKKSLRKIMPDGRRLRRPLQFQYGMAAVGNIPYHGNFKPVDRVSFVELIAKPKFVTGHIEIPYFIYEASKNDRGAFAKAMDVEIRAKQTALSKQLTRQALSNGAGEIAQLSSATGSSTGVITVSTANDSVGCIRFVEEGDALVPYTSTSDDSAVSMSNSAVLLKVISIEEDNNRFSVQPYNAAGASVNFAFADYSAGNVLVRTGITYNDTAAVPDFGYRSEEICGLETLINNTGVVHNIDRSLTSAYQSYCKNGEGLLLSTDMVQAAISGANKRGDGRPAIALMSHNTYNRFVEIAEEDRRLVSTKDGTLGFSRIGYISHFGNVQFVVEKYMRDDRIFMIDPKFLELYGKDFSFFEENGNVLRASVPSGGGYSPDYSSDLIGVMELFCTKPAAMSRVDNFILA